jgi:hypothetical protein
MGLLSIIGTAVDAFTGGTGIGTAIGGALDSATQSKSTAGTISGGANRAADIMAKNLQPYATSGAGATQQLADYLKTGGQFNRPFSMADAQNSDAEQFVQKRAMDAVETSAAARGGLLSSNALDQLQTTAGGIAAQFQNQAFNQWMEQNKMLLSGLEFQAGTGARAAEGIGSAGANAALTSAGAQAGAQVSMYDALNNATDKIGKVLFPGKTTNLTVDPYGMGVEQGSAMPYNPDVAQQLGDQSDYRFSDRRLKSDIRPLGRTNRGTPIYRYRMADGTKQVGVMSDEAPREAVAVHPSGFEMVDYSRV